MQPNALQETDYASSWLAGIKQDVSSQTFLKQGAGADCKEFGLRLLAVVAGVVMFRSLGLVSLVTFLPTQESNSGK